MPASSCVSFCTVIVNKYLLIYSKFAKCVVLFFIWNLRCHDKFHPHNYVAFLVLNASKPIAEFLFTHSKSFVPYSFPVNCKPESVYKIQQNQKIYALLVFLLLCISVKAECRTFYSPDEYDQLQSDINNTYIYQVPRYAQFQSCVAIEGHC